MHVTHGTVRGISPDLSLGGIEQVRYEENSVFKVKYNPTGDYRAAGRALLATLGWPAVRRKSRSLMRKSIHAGRNPDMHNLPPSCDDY